MDVWLRVTIAVFVVLAPTALFLGLWRGMMHLRDDELASVVTARQLRGLFDTLPSGRPNAGRFEEVTDGGIGEAAVGRSRRSEPAKGHPRPRASEIEIGVEPDSTECSRCGEPNPTAAELCWDCGAYLNE